MTETVIDFARALDGAPAPKPLIIGDDGKAAPQEGHYCRLDADIGYAAGQVTLGAFNAVLAPLSAHVMVIVLDGEIALREADGTEILLWANDAAILPRGMIVYWRNADETKVNFMMLDGEDTKGEARPIRLDPDMRLMPGAQPNEALLETPMPQCASHKAFADSTGQLEAGVWSSTPYTRRINTVSYEEMMFLQEGSVTITDGQGQAHQFSAGDCFIIKRGEPWAWHNAEPVRKIFVILDPAA